jgi:hypothetical protein
MDERQVEEERKFLHCQLFFAVTAVGSFAVAIAKGAWAIPVVRPTFLVALTQLGLVLARLARLSRLRRLRLNK